jgi:hypothetical protein
MRQLVEGLVPLVERYIRTEWDWKPWLTKPPTVPSGRGGPSARSPEWNSTDTWTIDFEGAYPWAIGFSYAALEEGPVKQYLDENGLAVDCEAGWAISVTTIYDNVG